MHHWQNTANTFSMSSLDVRMVKQALQDLANGLLQLLALPRG